jgi:hypothetical protein
VRSYTFLPLKKVSIYAHSGVSQTPNYLKYKEVNRYQHKRALALTARKLVRLVFRLLKDNRLYKPSVA